MTFLIIACASSWSDEYGGGLQVWDRLRNASSKIYEEFEIFRMFKYDTWIDRGLFIFHVLVTMSFCSSFLRLWDLCRLIFRPKYRNTEYNSFKPEILPKNSFHPFSWLNLGSWRIFYPRFVGDTTDRCSAYVLRILLCLLWYFSLNLSNILSSSLTQATLCTVLLASYVTCKIIVRLPVMNSHLAQYLPVEFSYLFHGTIYPPKKGR